MRFWKQHQTVVVQTTYRVYLLGCTRNAAISARQNQRKEERRTTYNLDDYGTTENTAIFQLEASDIADCIERAITRMPTVRNEVVRVVIENDSTHREAAEILGIAERTVIDHMHQANKDIKRALIRADLLTSEQAERISKGRWAPWLAQLRNTSMPVLQELPDA